MEAPWGQAGRPKADGTQFSLPEANAARCDIPTPTKPHQTVGTLGLVRTPSALGCAGTPGRGTWATQTNGTEGDNPSFPCLGIVTDLHPPGEGRRTPSFPTWPEKTSRPGFPPLHCPGPGGSPRPGTAPVFKGGPLRTDRHLHPTSDRNPVGNSGSWARDSHALPFKGFVSPFPERDPEGQLGTSPPHGRWSHLPLSHLDS